MRIVSPNGRIGVKIRLGPGPEHPQECGDCTPTGLAMVDAPPRGGSRVGAANGHCGGATAPGEPRTTAWGTEAAPPPRATPRSEPATAWGLLLGCPGGLLLQRGRPFRLQGSPPCPPRSAPRARSLQSTPQGQAARPAWGPLLGRLLGPASWRPCPPPPTLAWPQRRPPGACWATQALREAGRRGETFWAIESAQPGVRRAVATGPVGRAGLVH